VDGLPVVPGAVGQSPDGRARGGLTSGLGGRLSTRRRRGCRRAGGAAHLPGGLLVGLLAEARPRPLPPTRAEETRRPAGPSDSRLRRTAPGRENPPPGAGREKPGAPAGGAAGSRPRSRGARALEVAPVQLLDTALRGSSLSNSTNANRAAVPSLGPWEPWRHDPSAALKASMSSSRVTSKLRLPRTPCSKWLVSLMQSSRSAARHGLAVGMGCRRTLAESHELSNDEGTRSRLAGAALAPPS